MVKRFMAALRRAARDWNEFSRGCREAMLRADYSRFPF